MLYMKQLLSSASRDIRSGIRISHDLPRKLLVFLIPWAAESLMQSSVATKSSETDSSLTSIGTEVVGVSSVAKWNGQCVNINNLWLLYSIPYHRLKVHQSWSKVGHNSMHNKGIQHPKKINIVFPLM